MRNEIRIIGGCLPFLMVIICFGCNRDIITQQVIKGSVVIPNGETSYRPESGQRYLVSRNHQLPDDMIVQGDRINLSVDLSKIKNIDKDDVVIKWGLKNACGNSRLASDNSDKTKATFFVDDFGRNVVESVVTSGDNIQRFTTEIFCEFSTNIMLEHDFSNVKLPSYESDYLTELLDSVVGHRENFMVRNKNTGRIVSFWWAKIKHPKAGALGARWTGLASIFSDNNGLSWHTPQFIVLQDEWRTGWATGIWQDTDGSTNGEFIIATATQTHNKENQIIQFRSTDNAESWTFEKDHSADIKKMFGIEHLAGTYFGGNRTIKTSKGTLVAPMVSNQFARIVWSDDNGKSWQNSNVDNTFPQGNEDALIQTLGGEKLVLFSRSTATKERKEKGCPYNRFESVDGGKIWKNMGQSKIPTAGVNLGLDIINDINSDWNGQAILTTSARFLGRHNRNQLTVSVNRDVKNMSEENWDTRLLQNYVTNYTDVLYIPADKSIFVTAETWYYGKPYTGKHQWGDTPIIRYFKFSPRYFNHLPKYNTAMKANEIVKK